MAHEKMNGGNWVVPTAEVTKGLVTSRARCVCLFPCWKLDVFPQLRLGFGFCCLFSCKTARIGLITMETPPFGDFFGSLFPSIQKLSKCKWLRYFGKKSTTNQKPPKAHWGFLPLSPLPRGLVYLDRCACVATLSTTSGCWIGKVPRLLSSGCNPGKLNYSLENSH